MQESLRQSIEYVQGLDIDCTLDHGYRCLDVEEDDFLSHDSDSRLIPAIYLGVWPVVHADFMALEDLSEEQKELKHYKIGFTESESDYVVLFQALLLPAVVDGEPSGLTRSTFGQSMKYWVDKTSMQIRERLLLR